MLTLYLIMALGLVILNAVFVLAEFGAVKVRSSKIEELINQGNARAMLLKHINENLDEYLSVCQVGITLCSIALGFVSAPIAAGLLVPLFHLLGVSHASAWSHGCASIVAILIVSGVHVLFGEQIPKLIAIRHAHRVAGLTAIPLTVARGVFILPLYALNGASRLVLRLLGMHRPAEEQHSEDELRIILDRSQSTGVMSFRRLLFMENIFELGGLKVVDAMRRRTSIRYLHAHAPFAMNLEIMQAYHYSRFPLLEHETSERPLGFIHVKDIVLKAREPEPDLHRLVRPYLTTTETTPLESLLAEMQRKRGHVAIVLGAGGVWTGMITMEDIIEEIIGTVADEFETEAAVTLGEVLSVDRILLGVQAQTLAQAIRQAVSRVADADLGVDREQVIRAVMEREKIAGTYLGQGVALPHARIPALAKPILMFLRSDVGIPVEGTTERAFLLFLLLTPAGMARVHQRLQARIAGILENSDYVEDRLRAAPTPVEVLEVIRTGEQASLD